MLNESIIGKFSSEWASPLVLVRKPSGDLRICVDYRQNEVTAVTSYPLDDVICFHCTFEEHLEGMGGLIQMVRKSGFKLSGKKCQFATRSVKFLGHFIDKSGVLPLPEKLEIIRNLKAFANEAELRQFLGVCTFWRRFVKDFAKVAVPLHSLLNKPELVWISAC